MGKEERKRINGVPTNVKSWVRNRCGTVAPVDRVLPAGPQSVVDGCFADPRHLATSSTSTSTLKVSLVVGRCSSGSSRSEH